MSLVRIAMREEEMVTCNVRLIVYVILFLCTYDYILGHLFKFSYIGSQGIEKGEYKMVYARL
jgi:hypothetical protein